jgi:hypothetical protein
MFALRTSARLLNRNFLHTSRTNFNVNHGSENKIIEELQRANLELEYIGMTTRVASVLIACLYGLAIGERTYPIFKYYLI